MLYVSTWQCLISNYYQNLFFFASLLTLEHISRDAEQFEPIMTYKTPPATTSRLSVDTATDRSDEGGCSSLVITHNVRFV